MAQGKMNVILSPPPGVVLNSAPPRYRQGGVRVGRVSLYLFDSCRGNPLGHESRRDPCVQGWAPPRDWP